MALSLIAREILKNAFCQLTDAEYENNARLYVGDEMILVDHDDFEELRNDILSFDPYCGEEIKLKEFKQIVPTWED
jgi:hypothetical protein